MNAVKLEKLLIGEVSGVDDPANCLPGWAVMKAKGEAASAEAAVADPDPLLKDAAAAPHQEDSAVEAPPAVQAEAEVATGLLKQIRGLLLGTPEPTPKEDVDMTADELSAALDARDTALVEKFAGIVKAAVETPVETPAEGEPAANDTPAVEAVGLTAEDLTKAIEAATEPFLKAFEGTLNRIERIEKVLALSTRKSLEGQEGGTEGDGSPVAAPVEHDLTARVAAKRRELQAA